MNVSKADRKSHYFAEKNVQLYITQGSYLLRLAVIDHPLIEGDISVSMGIAKQGDKINISHFYNIDQTWRIKIELIQLEDISKHQLEARSDSNRDNFINCLLNMFIQTESSLLYSQQAKNPVPNTIRLENLKTIPSNYHFTSAKNCAVRFIDTNMKKGDMPSLFINHFNVKPYLLETPIALVPAYISFVSGEINLDVDLEWDMCEDSDVNVHEIAQAWVNFIVSIYLLGRLDNYDKRLSSVKLRARSNNLSNIILGDYSGEKDISIPGNILSSLPISVVEHLRDYLVSIGLKLNDLCLPSRFSSSNHFENIIQILNISYIPYRSFNTSKIHDCRKIGSYILFQGEQTQLHLQSSFGRIILPKDIPLDTSRPITCLQIFNRLPEKVRWWTLIYFMLKGTYVELSVVVLIALSLSLITLLPPLVITYTMAHLLPYSTITPFVQIIGLLLVVGSVAFILKLIQARYSVRLETKADINIQTFTTSRLLQLPAAAILNENSGDLESRVANLSQLRSIFTSTLSPSITLTLTIVLNLGLMVYYSWPSALFSLIPLSIISVSSLYVGYEKSTFLKTVLKNDGKIFAGLFMYMKGALPIRSNLCTDFVRFNYLKSARPLIVSLFKATRLGNRLKTLEAVIRPLTYVFIFGVISFMTYKGWETGINIAIFAGFSAALTTVFESTRTLVDSIFGQLIQGVAIWQRSLEFLDIKPENPYSTISRLNPTGKLTFKNVSFYYPNNAQATLIDISFEVESGEFIGITGESGCGKSTLMRMAYAVLEPTNGAIYYDRISQSQVNKRSLRDNFGVITQDVKLINGSLRDNLLAGIYLDDSKVFEVLEATCLKEFVDNLPMGLETMMNETSASFSMGQRQLIIIARALLKQPRILFMDEATSYLDNNTESIITQNIQHMGITRFAVAHRLSSIEKANRILMLGDRKILGFDSHSNLLRKCPQYKNLYISASF